MDWQNDILVSSKDDGYHVTLPNPNVRTKLADAIRTGDGPLVLGHGKQRCTIDFGSTDTQQNAVAGGGFR